MKCCTHLLVSWKWKNKKNATQHIRTSDFLPMQTRPESLELCTCLQSAQQSELLLVLHRYAIILSYRTESICLLCTVTYYYALSGIETVLKVLIQVEWTERRGGKKSEWCTKSCVQSSASAVGWQASSATVHKYICGSIRDTFSQCPSTICHVSRVETSWFWSLESDGRVRSTLNVAAGP